MIEKPYFVILKHEKGAVPLVEKDGFLATFELEKDAAAAGENNKLGNANGFAIFEIGGGL